MTEELITSDHVDDVYRCLSDRRRRRIIRYLEDTEQISINMLSEELATDGNQTMEEVRAQLYHWDLRMLDDAAIVVYDEETGTVERGHTYEVARLILPP